MVLRDYTPRPKISSERWVEYARTAFSVDPRIALSLASRFPANATLKIEITLLVQVCLFSLLMVIRTGFKLGSGIFVVNGDIMVIDRHSYVV